MEAVYIGFGSRTVLGANLWGLQSRKRQLTQAPWLGEVCVCVCVCVCGQCSPLWLFCCFLAGFLLLSPLLGSLAPAHCCTKCWPLCKPHPYCDPIRDALLSFNSQTRR